MSNAPQGFGVWIAFQGMIGSIDESIKRLKACGAKWVAPRAGEGPWRDSQWTPAKAREAIQKYHAAGIKVFPWVYSRPNTYEREIPLFVQLMEEGADGVFIDAEIEWQAPGGAHKAAAADFMAKLREKLGEEAFIAHAPFPYVLWHTDFPYVEFGAKCDAVCDQLYWTEINGAGAKSHIDATVKQWAEYLKKNPTACKLRAPIGVTYGSELKGVSKPPPGAMKAEDLKYFISWCQKEGMPFYSVYSLEASTRESLDTLAEIFATNECAESCETEVPEGDHGKNWAQMRQDVYSVWFTSDSAKPLVDSLATDKQDPALEPSPNEQLVVTEPETVPWYVAFVRFVFSLIAALFGGKKN